MAAADLAPAPTQSLRQASVRAATATANTYEGDWHALFDLASITAGPFNGRLLAYINLVLGSSYINLVEAQQAFAAAQGATSWTAMGGFTVSPAPYAAYTTVGAKSVDNGWYEVYVEPNNGSDGWSTVKVTTGSFTLAKAASQASLTRARLYGPYGLAPAATSVGSALSYGVVLNSTGAGALYGSPRPAPTETPAAAASSSPAIASTHEGWCTDGTNYYTINNLDFRKRARDGSWTLVDSNTSPFNGMSGTNHLGGCDIYNGELIIPVENYSATPGPYGSGSNQRVAFYTVATSGMPLARSLDVSAIFGTDDISGLCYDTDRGEIIACSYTNSSYLWRINPTTGALIGTYPLPSGFNSIQDVAYRSGQFWVSGSRNTSSGRSILVVDRAGTLQRRYLMDTILTGLGIEGIAFDTDGTFGVLGYNAGTSAGTVKFLAVTAVSNWTKSGFLAAQDRTLLTPGLQPSASYSVFAIVTPTTLVNNQAIWDSGEGGTANDAEGFISSTGTVSARQLAAETSGATFATAATRLVVGFTYDSSTGSRALYGNGVNKATATGTAGVAYPTNGSFSIGGTNASNVKPDMLFSAVYLFNRALTLAENQAIEADPFSVWTPTNALTAAQKALVTHG